MTDSNQKPKILMLTLFPFSGNGSATVVRDLATVLSPQIECMVYYIDIEHTEVKDYQTHFKIVDDFPVLRTHPKSIKRQQFIQMSKSEIDAYIQYIYEDLSSVVKRFQPEVIHVHHGWLGATVAKRIKDDFGIPYLIQFHGTELEARHDYEKENPEIFAYLDQYVTEGLNAAESFVAISPTEEVSVLKYKTESQIHPPVKMIPNGYDEEVFYPSKVDFKALNEKFAEQLDGFQLSPEKPIVMYVGRFVGFKGIEHLIRAVPHFSNDTQTILCGGGELHQDMVALRDELKLKNVFFLGHVDHFDDLPTLYSASDMLVIPSEGEPFGLVAIESMGCGTPVVGSKSGALPYILSSSEEDELRGDLSITPLGVLVPFGDSIAIAKAVDWVIKSKLKAQKKLWISQQVNENFSIKSQADSFLQLYTKMRPNKKM